MKTISSFVFFIAFLFVSSAYSQSYLGNLNSNRYDPNSLSNPYGAGSVYKKDGLNNPYGQYGSPYSNKSSNNKFATEPPKLYDGKGNFRGNLSTNPFDPDSINNSFGRYGSRYSPDSLNNPYGAGSRYKKDSPNNPYGTGWRVFGK